MNVAPSLCHFVDEHFRVHGRDQRARRYIERSLDLWENEYGAAIAAQVRGHMEKAWNKQSKANET